MRKQLIRTLLAAGTTAAALTLAVPAAMAAGTWTVTGGPSFTSAAATGTTFTLSDTTSGLSFTCTVGASVGTVTVQNGSTNTAIGHVTSSSFGSSAHKCNGPLGSTGTSTQTSGTTATLNAVSFASGVTTGTITGVDHTLTISSFLGTCTARVKGTAGTKYNNSSHLLQFTTTNDNLKVVSTSGSCSGIIKTNDVVTFSSGSGGETVTGSPTPSIQVSQP
ncbi:MAG TPA: hypothetical protein VFQ44_30105 [Streptosporangiaceae bacterium]|nr:hypothetical protein [Streptosporangiaceae bacterium]